MHRKREISVEDLAKILECEVKGEGKYKVNDVNLPEEADEKSVIILSKRKFLKDIESSKSRVILTAENFVKNIPDNKILLISKDVELSMVKLLDFFEYKVDYNDYLKDNLSNSNISSEAIIFNNVTIGKNVKIGKNSIIFSNVFIGEGVTIGNNTIIRSGVSIYEGVKIGNNVLIHSGAVIGADGFGFIQRNGENVKVPQIGDVIIEDNVEIGANSAIDRATIGHTLIKKGVKIDNLVQIGHNNYIGENVIIAGQAGVSGSCKIEKNVIIAGQAGIADHTIIEEGVIIGAQTGVVGGRIKKEVKMVFGTPSRPLMQSKRIEIYLNKLPELFNDVERLKKEKEDNNGRS